MPGCILKLFSGKSVQLTRDATLSGNDIYNEAECYEHLPNGDYYIVCLGRRIAEDDEIQNGATCSVVPRLPGGKGGFGSMLRAIGAQIEKTTNREACRDLSGRRMRDVNNEKKLRDWVGRQADREREKEERRKARMERRRALPRHNFSDPLYEQQKMQVTDNLDDALQQGLKSASSKSSASSEGSMKRKSEEAGPSTSKKACEWYGVDIDPDDLSDSESSDETDSEDGAKPGPSFQPPDSGNVSPSTDKLSDTETQSDSGVDSLVDRKEEPAVANVEPEQSAESMEVDSATPQGRSLEARTKVGGEAGAAGGTCAREEDKEKTKPEPSGRQDGSGNQSVETGSKGEGNVEPDLSQYTSESELESLGLEVLKAALLARGLKCGGTLTERAKRLFPYRCLTKDQIDPALLTKGGKSKGKGKKK